jgi:hypothetical protein
VTTNVDLEWVPWEILETVKARILSRRRQLQDAQEQQKKPVALQPKPQFAKFGADSRNWRLPEPAAVGGGGYGWLLVPSGGYDSNSQGYPLTIKGFPRKPLKLDQYNQPDGLVYTGQAGDAALAVLSTLAGYTSDPTTVPASTFSSFTFEMFIGGAVATNTLKGLTIELQIITQNGDPYHLFVVSVGVINGLNADGTPDVEAQRTISYIGNGDVLDLGYVSEPLALHAQMRHFALVRSEQAVSIYLDGILLDSTPAVATGADPVRLDFTLQGGTGGVNLTSEAYKIKGIRLTPGRALYSGESFNPPTSITTLA